MQPEPNEVKHATCAQLGKTCNQIAKRENMQPVPNGAGEKCNHAICQAQAKYAYMQVRKAFNQCQARRKLRSHWEARENIQRQARENT